MEGWSPEGRMGDQLGGPEYALLVPIYRATNPSGEVSLSAAAADVTPAELVALLGRSVVGCTLAPRIHQTPSTPRRRLIPEQFGPGYDPGSGMLPGS